MLLYTLADVRRAIEPLYFERGLDYQRERRIQHLNISPNGRLITATARGSGRNHYKVIAYIAPRTPDKAEVRGVCACPVGVNCKHVAAVLLEALAAETPLATPAREAATPAPQGDPALKLWLERLARAAAPEEEPAVKTAERLLYLLHLDTLPGGPRLRVRPASARQLKDGGYSGVKPFRTGHTSTARFLLPVDHHLLRWLHVLDPLNTSHDGYYLDDADGARVLAGILATGRCHHHDAGSAPLAPGEPRAARFEWTLDDTGTQRLRASSADTDVLLPLTPPWYLDLTHRLCGPLRTGLPDAVAAALACAPPIAAAQASLARASLQPRMTGLPVELPREFTQSTVTKVKPVPCLELFTQTLRVHRRYAWELGESIDVALARLGFDYQGTRVTHGDPRAELTHVTDGALQRIARDARAEKQALATLRQWSFTALDQVPVFDITDEDARCLVIEHEDRQQALLTFSLHGLPALRERGWRIDIAENYPYRIAEAGDDDWYAHLDEGAGHGWFDLELGVTVDGEQVNLLPVLLETLRQSPGALNIEHLRKHENKHALFARLPDGRLLPLPAERLLPILTTLVELYDEDTALDRGGRLRLPAVQAAGLAGMEDTLGARTRWEGGERLRAWARKLRDSAGLREVPAPQGLQAQLRPYQQQGLNWLQTLREHELGGILADDMGLGKTVQTLAHILTEKENGRLDRPCLVVAPTSLMVNWRMEAERFAPRLKVLVLHGAARKQHFEDLTAHDVILTTYPLLPRDEEALLKQDYHLLILDEAHVIKNAKTKASAIVRAIRARHRVCLTGTPMENHLGELWSLFDFLMPGLLGDERRFRRLFRTPIEKSGDNERRDALKRRIAPFLLRRTKQEVVKELPPKTDILRNVELDGAQRELYESIRLAMHARVREEIRSKGLARSQIVILDALLKLRQVCCDPRLVKLDSARKVKRSAKLELLMEMLPELIEEGRRVLLFSQFTSMLALIEQELESRKLDYVTLTGDTRDRATPVKKFQAGKTPLFLISLKAGGTGLNLTAADTVIHYDPWWNPAVENQATGRAHRIGQDKPVFSYKLITAGTVEEKILRLQTRKQELADSLFDTARKDGPLITPEDLEALFEPLG